MSFLFAPRLYSLIVLQAQCPKNGDFSEGGKGSYLLPSAAVLRFETLCRGASRHPRCGSLHSNRTILRYDIDVVIADLGQDLARIQAQPLFEFRLVLCSAKARFSVQTGHVIAPMQRAISIAKRRANSGDTAQLIPFGYGGMLLLGQ